MSVGLRRRTPAEVAAYLDSQEARLTELIPDEQQRADFKAELVAAAGTLYARERIPVPQPRVTCPACGRTSTEPGDVAEGYCGACHAWTSERQS